jgi:hypothetical protein
MNDDTRQIDAELSELVERLDRLAGTSRDIPDAGFEARCMENLRREVFEPMGEPIPIASSLRMRVSMPWVLAAAASIALAGTAGMMMWANRTAPVPSPVLAQDDAAEEFDEFIETVAWLEESLPVFASSDEQDDGLDLDALDSLFDDVEQTLGDEESM